MTPALAIRFAMLLGVLMFGGVTYFLRSAGSLPAPTVEPATLVLGGRIIWAVALLGSAFVFSRMRRAQTQAQLLTTSIIGWAFGESVALYGGVVYFLTGLSSWYLLGLGFLVLTFIVFPARRE